MAKYSVKLQGNYNDFIQYVEDSVVKGSFSTSVEEKHTAIFHDVTCTVLVFERYSYTGKNRVSMSVNILGHGLDIYLIATASGGSQATFFKINTWGEEAFLDTLIEPVKAYIQKMGGSHV